jgi:hypothetical protein
MVQKHHTDAYELMGKSVPATDRTVTVWMGSSAARMDPSADTSVIVDFEKSIMRVLVHSDKAYTEMALQNPQDMMAKAMEDAGADADDAAAMQMMQSMIGAMKFTVSVTETAETKKIQMWNCRKYTVKTQIAMVSSEAEVWATQDIKVDPALYQRALNSRLLQMPGALQAMQEYAKMKGVPVHTTTRTSMMGATFVSTESLLSAEQKAAPAGTYSAPKGYALKN